jgi:holo-[acyl-carrier protein] synthase
VVETGVDIVEIARVADLARRYGDRFGRRVFSAAEWLEFRDRPASLAARFAAKEATIKALGWRDIALHEIRVQRQEDMRPTLELVGRARVRAQALGVHHLALSLSHSRDYAVAVVVVERDDGSAL